MTSGMRPRSTTSKASILSAVLDASPLAESVFKEAVQLMRSHTGTPWPMSSQRGQGPGRTWGKGPEPTGEAGVISRNLLLSCSPRQTDQNTHSPPRRQPRVFLGLALGQTVLKQCSGVNPKHPDRTCALPTGYRLSSQTQAKPKR